MRSGDDAFIHYSSPFSSQRVDFGKDFVQVEFRRKGERAKDARMGAHRSGALTTRPHLISSSLSSNLPLYCEDTSYLFRHCAHSQCVLPAATRSELQCAALQMLVHSSEAQIQFRTGPSRDAGKGPL